MMAHVSDVEPFVRFVEALHPWLSHVTVVGGWAHRLHRVHPLAQPLEYPPLMTRDADIAVPVDAIPSGDDICERLLEAGFKEEFSRGHRPPVTRYQLGGETGGFYADLTRVVGSVQTPAPRRSLCVLTLLHLLRSSRPGPGVQDPVEPSGRAFDRAAGGRLVVAGRLSRPGAQRGSGRATLSWI
jgi:hypothetical protein